MNDLNEVLLEEDLVDSEFADKLQVLRDYTDLNFIAYLKVLRARKQAESLNELTVHYSGEVDYGPDYSVADDLEYAYRREILQDYLEEDWDMYCSVEHDGLSLTEFTDMFIGQKLEERKSKVRSN